MWRNLRVELSGQHCGASTSVIGVNRFNRANVRIGEIYCAVMRRPSILHYQTSSPSRSYATPDLAHGFRLKLIGQHPRMIHRRPDISDVQRLPQWHPTAPITKGLEAAVRYFGKLLADAVVAQAL